MALPADADVARDARPQDERGACPLAGERLHGVAAEIEHAPE